jgi:hypothetical protein
VTTATPHSSNIPGTIDSESPCAPPTVPTGFIYPSYRAAGTEV